MSIKINDLPKVVGKAQLFQVNHCSIDRDKLKNIKWWTYGFKKDFMGYNSIMLMNFKITENDDAYKEVIKHIELNYVTKISTPHIDGNSGNIHPGIDYIDKNGYSEFNKINMFVLSLSGISEDGRVGVYPGALNVNLTNVEDDEQYSYLTVHKACYFPLMVKDNNLKKDPRYKFLKEFALELYNSLDDKSILSDEILEEIGKK